MCIRDSCTIDRGSVKNTKIEDYCKLDNQVHLAHNVKIGEGCLIAGGVFIGGSSIIEDFVTIAGKSDIGPHIKIGSKTVLAARSCVLKSLPGSAMYGGNPARPIKEKQKRDALFTRFEILESGEEDALAFIDDFKMDLKTKDIYVFTPNGDMKTLPKGATTLDFAFRIICLFQINNPCLPTSSSLSPSPLFLSSSSFLFSTHRYRSKTGSTSSY